MAQSSARGRGREANEGSHFGPSGHRAALRWVTWPGDGPAAVPVVAAFSGLATVLSWRAVAWRPVLAGLNSWQAGLTLGFLHHLQWGPQMLFTFGPYGFVEDILPYSHLTATLGFLYALLVAWGVAALIVSALRVPWGLLPAATAAWAALAIAANLVEAPELGVALALGLTLACLGAPGPEERRRLGLLAVLGAFAGFQLLVEIDVGLVSAALAALAVVGQTYGRRRALVAVGLPFAGTAVVALIAAGQSLGNLPSYLRGSLSVLLGYVPAMALSGGRQAEDFFAAVDVALLAVIFALAFRGRPVNEKAAISVALVGWTWAALKEGFVRHDKHDLIFFALVLVALCLARLPRLPLLQAGAIAVAAVLACVANGRPPLPMRSPVEDVTALAQNVRALSGWGPVERTARLQLLSSGDALPPGLLASLEGRTVAFEPLEDDMTFTYPELRWDPEPVLQAYSAYTTYLDTLDAGFLGSAVAPERVLYRPAIIDGRDPVWDPPATMLALYCHYVPVSDSDNWLVLARTPERCGQPHLIRRATAHFGQPVPVPRASGEMVVATFSLSSPLTAEIQGLLLKPPIVELTADGVPYRFLTGTAGDDHVLSVPVSFGYPPGAAPTVLHRIEFSGGGWAVGQGSVRISFYSVATR